ncbi:MAG: IS110 family transposase [Proteobacteria bacterium]|nr:MAG: IS110 family transposase [Pseudomonadota bacterium]
MTLYAGLDWASAEHAVCVIDRSGTVVDRLTIPHTAEGLGKLVRALDRHGQRDGAPVATAIERPSGLVVDTLVEAGQPVVPIHPNVVKATRPRYGASCAKSDPGDAYLLADLLRTDGHRFRALEPLSDPLRALRSKVRTRDDLVAARVRMANQLRSLLEVFWPGAVAIFADVDSPIGLDFIQRYPAPRDAARLGPKRLARFLAAHRYSGRRTPEELLERLRAVPTGLAGDIEEESRRMQALAFVSAIRPLVAQIRKLTSSIEHDIQQLAIGRTMMSFPRAGKLNAAQIVAELGDNGTRFVDADHLAAEAGVAPVTRASGKRSATVYRFACNKRLRNAICTWANNSRRASDWAAHVYQRARARGCDHPHATRILARAWCRVLWRVWQDGGTYDVERHAAARALIPPPAHPDDA